MCRNFQKTICFLAAALCLVLCFRSAASAQDGTDTAFATEHPSLIHQFESLARSTMKTSGIPGMSIALVDDKGILWAEGFGYTDQSHGRPVDADTIFSIQSISKTITGTAVVEAAQKGLLYLDKPITDYLPDFTVNSVFEEHPERKITLRNLLSHTAGFTIEAPVGSNYDADAASFEDHIMSISDTWLRFPVGRDYGYSNLGVDLAGYILQKASGQSFQSYVDQNMTGPYGMANSTFDMVKIKKNPNRAAGNHQGYYKMPLEIPMIPSGGFYSSANDMAKFIQHHLNNSSALGEMYSIPFPINGQTEGYALGVGRTDKYNTWFLNHGGGSFGFIASLIWFPELKIGVVVLTNSSEPPAGYIYPLDLAMGILDGVIADSSTVYHSRMEQMPAPSKPATNPNLDSKLVSDVAQGLIAVQGKPLPDASRYGGYAGTYTQTSAGVPFFYGIITLSEKNGSLYKDGSMLTEVQPGLFFTNDGEALDLRGSTKMFRNIAMQKLPFGITFTGVLLADCFAVFIAAIVLLIRRRKKCRSNTAGLAAAAARVLQGASAGLNIVFGASFVCLAISFLAAASSQAQSLQVYQTIGVLILLIKILSPLALLLAAAAVVFCVFAWIRKYWTRFDRVCYFCVTIFGILFFLLMFRLNVIIL